MDEDVHVINIPRNESEDISAEKTVTGTDDIPVANPKNYNDDDDDY